jgi:hypothetical protein
MVPRLFTVALLATGLLAPALARAAGQEQAQTPPQEAAPETTDAFDLASRTLETLSLAASARARLTVADSQGLPQVMRNTRLALSRLDNARLQVRLSKESPDEAIQAAAGGLEASLDALINPQVSRVGAMEKLLAPDTETTEWRTLTTQVTNLNTQFDQAWRLLPASTVVVTQALVDLTRTLDGNLAYMKLTREEHRTLVADLERLFPGVSEEEGGDHPIAVSVRVLQAFVTSGWRAADERAPGDR